MNRNEHIAEAESLLAIRTPISEKPEVVRNRILRAQTHALLALASTTDEGDADAAHEIPDRMAGLLSLDEVAEMTGVSPHTLRYYRHRGEGPKSFKLGRRVKYRREDVEAWIATNSAGGAQ